MFFPGGKETSLEEGEEYYKALFDSLNVGFSIVGEDLRIKYHNRYLREVFGEGAGKKCYSHYFREKKPCTGCPALKVLRDKHPRSIEKRADRRFFNLSASLLAAPGDSRSVVEVFTDITERKLLEEELERRRLFSESIISSIKSAVIVTDRKHNVTEWNPAAEKLWGIRRKNSLGKDFFVLDVGGKAEGLKENMEKVMETGHPFRVEGLRYHRNGEERYLDIVYVPLIDEKGEIQGVVSIADDVTERKRMEREVKKAYEKLKEIDKIKDSIIARVSHELRTPITICKSALELALEERNEEERRKILLIGREALNRQNRIVGDLIEAVKMQKGRTELNLVTFDPRELVALIAKQMSHYAQRNGIKIKTRIPQKAPLIKGDFEKLKQALQNLIDNGIKFNHEGGEVVVELKGKKDKIEICVSDTGIGIPEKYRDRIFDVLYQIDGSITRRYSGTGMGLAVVKGIVEAHGGTIRVESQPDRGSKFCISLPTRPG
jgi:PAS domain S-box-containing protein